MLGAGAWFSVESISYGMGSESEFAQQGACKEGGSTGDESTPGKTLARVLGIRYKDIFFFWSHNMFIW